MLVSSAARPFQENYRGANSYDTGVVPRDPSVRLAALSSPDVTQAAVSM